MAFLLVDVCDISGTNHSLKVFLQQFQKQFFIFQFIVSYDSLC